MQGSLGITNLSTMTKVMQVANTQVQAVLAEDRF